MKVNECYSEQLEELYEGFGDILINYNDGMWIYTDFTLNPNTYLIKLKIEPKDKLDPYFDIIRISMLAPEYIKGEYKGRLLTKKELEIFIQALYLLSNNSNQFVNKGILTTWEALIKCHNDNYKHEDVDKHLPLNLLIPNYRLLETSD